MEGLIAALILIGVVVVVIAKCKSTTDKEVVKETTTKPKRITGVIGKVKVDGSYKYVCVDKYGIVWVGFSIWWYMLDGKNCGNNYSYFNDKYHAAQYKEAGGHVYPILDMKDLLDDDKRKELLENLK